MLAGTELLSLLAGHSEFMQTVTKVASFAALLKQEPQRYRVMSNIGEAIAAEV